MNIKENWKLWKLQTLKHNVLNFERFRTEMFELFERFRTETFLLLAIIHIVRLLGLLDYHFEYSQHA